MTWREGKESLKYFAHRVRAAVMALPEPVSDDTLLDRFIQSLPASFQGLAISVASSIDDVTGRVAKMSASMAAEAGKGMYRGERVSQMDEGLGWGEELVARVDPTLSQTPTPSFADERFISDTCYHCNTKAHIARYCPKKMNDRSDPARKPQGEEMGAGRTPSVQLP